MSYPFFNKKSIIAECSLFKMYRLKNCFRTYIANILKKMNFKSMINNIICSCGLFKALMNTKGPCNFLLNSHKSGEMEQIGDGMKTQRSWALHVTWNASYYDSSHIPVN